MTDIKHFISQMADDVSEVTFLIDTLATSLSDRTEVDRCIEEIEDNESAVDAWIKDLDRELANKLRDITYQESLSQRHFDQISARIVDHQLKLTSINDDDDDDVDVVDDDGDHHHDDDASDLDQTKENLQKQSNNYRNDRKSRKKCRSSEQRAINQQLKELEVENDLLRDKMEAIEVKHRRLKKNLVKLRHTAMKEKEVYMATVAAYRNVTKIRWTEKPNGEVIACFLPPQSLKHVSNLSVDQAAVDVVAATQQLWDRIETFSIPTHLATQE